MVTSDAANRLEKLSERLHTLLSHGNEPVTCWLALDGGTRPLGYPVLDSQDRVHAAMTSSEVLTLSLLDPQVDAQWYPTWLRIDVGQAAGSFLLQDSLVLASDELDPDRLEQGFGRRVAGWVEVDGGGAAAAQHVAQKMMQHMPSRGRHLIRLHDPAVMWAVWPVLSAEQQADWLGPVRRWTLLDPAGRLVSLHRPEVASATGTLTPSQWLDIENVAAMNSAFRSGLRLAGLTSEEVERARSVTVVALRRARQAGFYDFEDLMAYAEHVLLVDANFDSHPLVRQAIARRTSDESFTLLMEALTAEDWASVKQDLNATRRLNHVDS